MREGGEKPLAFDIPLKGTTLLLLAATDAGDGNNSDHADWLDVKIEYQGNEPVLIEKKDAAK